MTHQHDVIEAMCMFEIAHGTQRSAGVMYGIAIIGGVTADTTRCVRINKAIRERWGNKDSGRGALERVKKVGWDLCSAANGERGGNGAESPVQEFPA